MGALNLRVDVCTRIGYCAGITRAIKLLLRTLVLAMIDGRRVCYREAPHEAQEMIAKFERWTPVREWTEKTPKSAIQMISPYGAGPEAFDGPCADGTCPNVTLLRRKAIAVDHEGLQLILMADAHSSEIAFVNRFIGGRAKVISQFSDIDRLELQPGQIVVMCQTSFRRDLFGGLAEGLKERFPKPDYLFLGEATTCPELERRFQEIRNRTDLRNDPSTCLENLTFEDLYRLFPYHQVVLVGAHTSKQCTWVAVELKLRLLPTQVLRIEGPEDLRGDAFEPGQRILVAGGPEVSKSHVQSVVRKLRRLQTEDVSCAEPDPGVCQDCEQKRVCIRRATCLQYPSPSCCNMLPDLWKALAEMERDDKERDQTGC